MRYSGALRPTARRLTTKLFIISVARRNNSDDDDDDDYDDDVGDKRATLETSELPDEAPVSTADLLNANCDV